MDASRFLQKIAPLRANPWVMGISLTLYYLAIIAALVWMYGQGNFSSPDFIYQGF